MAIVFRSALIVITKQQILLLVR